MTAAARQDEPVTAAHSAGGLAVACHRLIHIYPTASGDVVALSGVDLRISAGEMLALVGPSGSGKSTLVAILGGLMQPSAGRVYVGEHELSRLSSKGLAALRGATVGTVLQGAERNLLPYVSLSRNIWLAQRPAARLAGRRLDPPEAILDLVGLAGAGARRVGDLTPGQRQRAALAQGLAAGPGLLLVDEPTSQLDASGRDEVLAALAAVNGERGTTVVVVTHDGEVGARLGRAVTIRDGRVGAEGRDGRDFAVVAGDGTIQLPPETVASFPAGTLLEVDHTDESITLRAVAAPSSLGGDDGVARAGGEPRPSGS
ncbi:ABC-type lipoprotein export system ATPase subunit [Micromonospora vinacea]|uniref:ABC-type lipoprotein export system ATPase subunit n=1 Tax=Micromonospora vinacea TaxID=709878 RepID=A0ABS0K440_9ACTN|nr:ATP-binding cassette domain-containing protein [Micromonospora vinacea]MBG6103352.1 ABC-type lipoprotein export system ATPase subunit [Micromonospora vinacea]